MRKVQKTSNIAMLLVVIGLIIVIMCCTGCSCSSSSDSSQEQQEQNTGYFTEIPNATKNTLTGHAMSKVTLVYDNETHTVYYMIYGQYGQKGNLNITPYIIEGKYTIYEDGIIKKVE